jgi:hypothetical protein
MQSVYVYVDGSDNKATERLLISAFSQLVGRWSDLNKNGVRFTYKGSLTPYFHARESIFSRAEPAAWVVSM